MKIHSFTLPIFLFCLAVYLLPAHAEQNKTKVNTLSHFRITDHISGWNEVEKSYKPFEPRGLYAIIDGGADEYIEKGLVSGIYQSLKKDKGNQCDVFVEDYGTPEKASSIFAVKTESVSESLSLEVTNKKKIRIEEFLGGILVYFHSQKYYFEISLSGFDSTDIALKNAEDFILYFEKILKKR